jgi:ribosomal protein L34E
MESKIGDLQGIERVRRRSLTELPKNERTPKRTPTVLKPVGGCRGRFAIAGLILTFIGLTFRELQQ